ncbi:MAG: DNA polymerase Y family protein [Paraglaciecola sp.]|nr:DNA polymerase Y family protein [Paraglaciecola sp.]
MKNIWLYLYFPNLQLDALLQQNPESNMQAQAYVILNEQTNQICQFNPTAYQAGIRLGMGLGTAAMLKGDLQVIAYQEKVTKNRLEDIAQHLYLITSDICFFNDNALLLRVHHMLNLYGNLTSYWQVVRQCLLRQRVHFHFATGYSPLAAKLLAITAWDRVTDDMQAVKQAVQKVSLQHTDLTTKAVVKLQRVGVHNIQGLFKIPLADIAKRFDIEVVTYIGKLTTEIPHPVDFFHPKTSFDRVIELLYDIENIQILQAPLSQLLHTLEQFLKTRDLLTQTLVFTLSQRDEKSIELNIHSQQGEYLAKYWAALISLKLENVTLSAPVFAIRLRVENTYIRTPDESDLFAGKQGRLSRLQLISVLQAKLGEQAVSTLVLTDDYRPEQIIQTSKQLAKPLQNAALYALRPSFLLTPPQRLQEKVSIAYGPERIETGWWDAKPITRDYFIARNRQGQWYWIFKTPKGEWYLHGVFS